MIRIMLADDHEVVRAGFKMILEQDPELEVVAEAADGAQAYAVAAREKPDILLMDISMPPGQSGLVACEKIAKDFPATKVIVLTMFAEPEYLFYTLRGGASGYVLKNSTSEELIAAVRAVAGGGSYIHPKMAALLTKHLVDGGEEHDRSYQQLSNRELEILQLLAKGFTNKEISEQIYLSVKTVEAHRSKIYQEARFQDPSRPRRLRAAPQAAQRVKTLRSTRIRSPPLPVTGACGLYACSAAGPPSPQASHRGRARRRALWWGRRQCRRRRPCSRRRGRLHPRLGEGRARGWTGSARHGALAGVAVDAGVLHRVRTFSQARASQSAS